MIMKTQDYRTHRYEPRGDKLMSGDISTCGSWTKSTTTPVRKPWHNLIVVTLLSALLIGCATIRSGSHSDEAASFDQYRTFAWMTENPLILGVGEPFPLSPLAQKKVTQAIKNELIERGFTYSSILDNADFVVAYTVGTREKIDATSYPVRYRGAWGWHLYGRYYYERDVAHQTYTEGTLGIDIFDGATKQPVWHGWARKTISSDDRDNPSPAIQKAVASIIARFPPRVD